MTDRSQLDSRLLVLVEPRPAAVATVEFALTEARDRRAETEGAVHLEVWLVGSPDRQASVDDIRGHLETALSTFDDNDGIATTIDFQPLASRNPDIRATDLIARIQPHRFDRVIVEADAELAVERLREAVGLATVELAPVDRRQPRRPLARGVDLQRVASVFGLAYLFYLAVGGFAGGPDLVTGAVSAAIVALAVSGVAFSETPRPVRTGTRLLRLAAVLPVLLWEIGKANVAIAALILHPRLPLDPAMETIETETRGGLERMALANGITLTPGTLAVDVRGQSFTVHSLTGDARRDLARGRLERLVAWVFHGHRRSEGAVGS